MVEERLNYPVNHRYQIIAFSTFNIITSQRTSLYQIATCTFQLILANGFDIRTDIEIDSSHRFHTRLLFCCRYRGKSCQQP